MPKHNHVNRQLLKIQYLHVVVEGHNIFFKHDHFVAKTAGIISSSQSCYQDQLPVMWEPVMPVNSSNQTLSNWICCRKLSCLFYQQQLSKNTLYLYLCAGQDFTLITNTVDLDMLDKVKKSRVRLPVALNINTQSKHIIWRSSGANIIGDRNTYLLLWNIPW
jgi:hypothetical protein